MTKNVITKAGSTPTRKNANSTAKAPSTEKGSRQSLRAAGNPSANTSSSRSGTVASSRRSHKEDPATTLVPTIRRSNNQSASGGVLTYPLLNVLRGACNRSDQTTPALTSDANCCENFLFILRFLSTIDAQTAKLPDWTFSDLSDCFGYDPASSVTVNPIASPQNVGDNNSLLSSTNDNRTISPSISLVKPALDKSDTKSTNDDAANLDAIPADDTADHHVVKSSGDDESDRHSVKLGDNKNDNNAAEQTTNDSNDISVCQTSITPPTIRVLAPDSKTDNSQDINPVLHRDENKTKSSVEGSSSDSGVSDGSDLNIPPSFTLRFITRLVQLSGRRWPPLPSRPRSAFKILERWMARYLRDRPAGMLAVWWDRDTDRRNPFVCHPEGGSRTAPDDSLYKHWFDLTPTDRLRVVRFMITCILGDNASIKSSYFENRDDRDVPIALTSDGGAYWLIPQMEDLTVFQLYSVKRDDSCADLQCRYLTGEREGLLELAEEMEREIEERFEKEQERKKISRHQLKLAEEKVEVDREAVRALEAKAGEVLAAEKAKMRKQRRMNSIVLLKKEAAGITQRGGGLNAYRQSAKPPTFSYKENDDGLDSDENGTVVKRDRGTDRNSLSSLGGSSLRDGGGRERLRNSRVISLEDRGGSSRTARLQKRQRQMSSEEAYYNTGQNGGSVKSENSGHRGRGRPKKISKIADSESSLTVSPTADQSNTEADNSQTPLDISAPLCGDDLSDSRLLADENNISAEESLSPTAPADPVESIGTADTGEAHQKSG